jgi:hypothetical protein
VLVTAVARAFKPAFLITGGLALLGAAALVILLGARFRLAALASAVALALLAPAAYGLTRSVASPEPVVIADPCSGRDLPDGGGLTGFLQDQALEQLDRLACENGSSREELVLAIADGSEALAYERRYGVNPRSLEGILDALPD